MKVKGEKKVCKEFPQPKLTWNSLLTEADSKHLRATSHTQTCHVPVMVARLRTSLLNKFSPLRRLH